MILKVPQTRKDKADILDRVDMASLLVDIGFSDVDPDAEESLLFCVFHNDSGTKSFSVNLRKKVFHCFSSACGISGSAITLYALWKKITYDQACQEIVYMPRQRSVERLQESIAAKAEQVSALRRLETLTEFVGRLPLLSTTPHAEALERRGIGKSLMDSFGLRGYEASRVESATDEFGAPMDPERLFAAGLANVWRRPVFSGHPILFPFRVGKYVAFLQGRLAQDDPNRPKYLGCRGTIPCLFNHGALNRRPRRVFLTEGVIDALSLESVGLSPALGIVGTQGFKPEWSEDFRGIDEIWIATDHDAAGEAAVMQLATVLRPSGASLGRLDFPRQFKDVNEAVVGGWRP